MATAKLFSKDLTPTEYKLWTGILKDFTDPAIEWGFEMWQRNGKFFPKPAEILEHVHAFGSSSENQVKLCGKCKDGWVIVNPEAKPSDYKVVRCECVASAIQDAKVATHRCDAECKRRHGQGYNENDLSRLFKKIIANAGKFEPRMLDELDQARGLVPEWRRA